MKYLLKFKLFEDKEEDLSNEELIKMASKYKTLLQLKRQNSKLYWVLSRRKLTRIAFPKKSKWTREEIEKESEKYNNRGEFSLKSNGAYVRALGLGILDELFPKDKSD